MGLWGVWGPPVLEDGVMEYWRMGLWSTGGWGYGVLENGFRILED